MGIKQKMNLLFYVKNGRVVTYRRFLNSYIFIRKHEYCNISNSSRRRVILSGAAYVDGIQLDCVVAFIRLLLLFLLYMIGNKFRYISKEVAFRIFSFANRFQDNEYIFLLDSVK